LHTAESPLTCTAPLKTTTELTRLFPTSDAALPTDVETLFDAGHGDRSNTLRAAGVR
jgi:hypothetical protein